MLILSFTLFLLTPLFTREIAGYIVPPCTRSSSGRFPYLKSCTKFLECKNGQVTVYSCTPGLVYNPTLAECDIPQNVPGCENIEAQQPTMVVCPRDFIGQVPHPKDCAQYAQCFRGLTHFMICGPGFVYNIETGSCDLRENVPGCQGDFGNGVNFRGDISIASQTVRSFPGRIEPYDGYHRRAPCLTPGCLPINQQPPPEVPSIFPSAPLPPFNKPPVPFRTVEITESTLNPITENSLTSTNVNLVAVSDKTTMHSANSYSSTEMVHNEENSSTTSAPTSSDILSTIANKDNTADYSSTSKTESEDGGKKDSTATVTSDLYSGEMIDVNITSTHLDQEAITTTESVKLNSEAETSVTKLISKTTKSIDTVAPEDTDSSEQGLRIIPLSQRKTGKKYNSRVNSQVSKISEQPSGRSADSSDSWFKKLWSSNSNTLENNDEIKQKEFNKNSSEDKSKNSNKNEAVNGKESTMSVSPAKSNSHQPFYVVINGTRYHYIYKDVHIDQDHSKVRTYNHAPLVANVKVSKIPSQIDRKSIDLEKSNKQLKSWLETEPPFPFSYTPPIYSRSLRNIPKLTPLSGQSLRLRGGSDLNHGYVEVQGSKPGWGIVCHTASNWTLQEADIICHQLGYSQGAQIVWRGRYEEDEIYPWVATSYVECQGNETWFQTCKFRDNSECNIQRDVVGIRCLQNNDTSCREDELSYGGYCYHLMKPNSNLNHEEAARYCDERSSSLLYITSQKENDFLSEWLIRQHPDVESITLGGLGFPALNQSHWIWKDTNKTKFTFSKWWPGWNNEKVLPPSVKSGISCIAMKKKFPCSDNPNTNCHTDYFFWDPELCGIAKQNSSYICKRSPNDLF